LRLCSEARELYKKLGLAEAPIGLENEAHIALLTEGGDSEAAFPSVISRVKKTLDKKCAELSGFKCDSSQAAQAEEARKVLVDDAAAMATTFLSLLKCFGLKLLEGCPSPSSLTPDGPFEWTVLPGLHALCVSTPLLGPTFDQVHTYVSFLLKTGRAQGPVLVEAISLYEKVLQKSSERDFAEAPFGGYNLAVLLALLYESKAF